MNTVCTFVLCLFTINALAQDSTLTTVAAIRLPKGMKVISPTEAGKLSRQRFSTSTRTLTDGRSFYYDSILISIHEMWFDSTHEKTLEKLKKDYDAVFFQVNTPVDTSYIDTTYNYKILIFESHLYDDHTVNFVTETREHMNLSGFIKFIRKDRAKAYEFLRELLSGISMRRKP